MLLQNAELMLWLLWMVMLRLLLSLMLLLMVEFLMLVLMLVLLMLLIQRVRIGELIVDQLVMGAKRLGGNRVQWCIELRMDRYAMMVGCVDLVLMMRWRQLVTIVVRQMMLLLRLQELMLMRWTGNLQLLLGVRIGNVAGQRLMLAIDCAMRCVERMFG